MKRARQTHNRGWFGVAWTPHQPRGHNPGAHAPVRVFTKICMMTEAQRRTGEGEQERIGCGGRESGTATADQHDGTMHSGPRGSGWPALGFQFSIFVNFFMMIRCPSAIAIVLRFACLSPSIHASCDFVLDRIRVASRYRWALQGPGCGACGLHRGKYLNSPLSLARRPLERAPLSRRSACVRAGNLAAHIRHSARCRPQQVSPATSLRVGSLPFIVPAERTQPSGRMPGRMPPGVVGA